MSFISFLLPESVGCSPDKPKMHMAAQNAFSGNSTMASRKAAGSRRDAASRKAADSRRDAGSGQDADSRRNAVTSFLIRKNAIRAALILTIAFTASCTPFVVTEPGQESVQAQEDWIIPDGPEQFLRERTWNLHHQKLSVRFRFEKEQVIGETEMLFTSKKTQSELILDAKTMEFDSIYDVRANRLFTYEQDSAIVTIQLERDYLDGDTLVLGVSFVSSPPQRGLYFVNPRGDDPVMPTQVWTLGQPEDNSFWFPTIDHPAERATQETWISVPDRFQTLSNGLLLDSRILPGDSLRTDYWRLHQPHTPYLFVLAVGEYEIVEEKKGDILYRYYVEPQFAETVDLIYKNTVDMIRFSEEILEMPYPWDPVYAQAPVRDFIARGMENTTATLLYDAVQLDARAAQDLCYQDLIMHEIIHMWFGNLVTCKDWANLPLNEGFANYFESAYRLHNNGRDEYLWKNHNDRLRYFAEAAQYRRPIIFNRYSIPEDMYDRHTYQKAGQVLRMLHDYLGDDIWWQGVRLWLQRHAFDAVDVFDLHSVFEDVSGMDLQTFVHQWFLEPGHPYLDVSHEISGNRAELHVRQVHDTLRQPLFTLYPEVLIEMEGEEVWHRISVDEAENTYYFEANGNIIDIILDPNRVQLAEYFRDISMSSLSRRMESDHLLVRAEALSMANDFMEYQTIRNRVAGLAMNDPFWGIRMTAYGLVADYAWMYEQGQALSMALRVDDSTEPDYRVRRESLNILRNLEIEDTELQELVRDHITVMMDDTSYFVSAEAIVLAGELYPDQAAMMVSPYAEMESYQDVLKTAVVRALILADDPAATNMLVQLAGDPGRRRYRDPALSHLAESVGGLDGEQAERVTSLFGRVIGDPNRDYRLHSYAGLSAAGAYEYLDVLREIKDHREMDEQEHRALKDTIRILEYNKTLNEQ